MANDSGMLAIVDYGLGNLGSIENMLRRVGCRRACITSDPATIRSAARLILPGVGHFDTGMSQLASRGLVDVLRAKALEERVPVLGICLGMQLMTRGSEEGRLPGLGWVDAEFRRFKLPPGSPLKVPHMGWNWVRFVRNSPLISELPEDPRFYFVHSYHLAAARAEDVIGVTEYGFEFGAAFQVGNLYGVQFHPERSHRYGKALLANFVRS